jgi:hypothetical protein
MAAAARENRQMNSRREVARMERSSSTRPTSMRRTDDSAAAFAARDNIWARGVWAMAFGIEPANSQNPNRLQAANTLDR